MPSPTKKMLIATIEVVGKPISKRNRPARFGEDRHKPWTALIVSKLFDSNLDGCRYVGAFQVDCDFRFSRPKSHFRKGQRTGELQDKAPKHHTVKPDRDNLDKAVLDALTQIDFWVDDALACDGRIRKLYCNAKESPGCTITIYKLEDWAMPEPDWQIGDVIQLVSPHCDTRFEGCLLVVDERHTWGVLGFVKFPGGDKMYLEVRWNEGVRIGKIVNKETDNGN